MSDQVIQRASLLIQHRRYEEAMRELQTLLATEPNHPYALALMGVSNLELDKIDEAIKHLQQALGSQPDNAYFLYLMGLAYLRKRKLKEATKFVQSAIIFDPQNSTYFGLLALIKFEEEQWEDSLTYANRGLEIDPEDVTCINWRSMALAKLDRKEESFQALKDALHKDPHNSNTHSNVGWALLGAGDHKKALESFREALKLDPENDHAKAGLVEALKARYWFYRVFLQYVFWMTNKTTKYQWAFMLGLWFGIRILNSVSESNPAIAPFVKPIVYLYSAFAVSTWIVVPLSNLFLRLNVYGRFALTKDQIRSSTFTGIGFLFTIAGLIGLLTTTNENFLGMTFYGVGFMILCGSMFKPTEKPKRAIAMTLALGLCAIGLLFVLMSFTVGGGGLFFMIFIYGTIAYQFIINALITR